VIRVLAMKRRPSPSTKIVPLVLVSVALHAVMAVVVGRWATDLKERIESAPTPTEAVAPAVPFAFACTVDIGAMVATRLAYCATPVVADAEACADQAISSFEAELILCEMQPTDLPALAVNDAAEVRLIDPKAIAAIKPMPLIPALPPTDPAVEAKKEEERVEEKVAEEKREEMRAAASAQIVEITQPKLEIRPDKARYVSEFDSKVDKQTVARASTDKMVARPGATKDQPAREVDDTPKVLQPRETETTQGTPGARPGRAGAAGLLAMRGGGGSLSPLQRLSRDALSSGARLPGTDGMEPVQGDQKPGGPGPGERGGQGGEGGDGGARVPNLRPSEDLLQKMVGGGSVDKLDDAEQGIETALNSRRWKYASFFNRMKRRVAQSWHPAEVYMQRDPTGRVYGSKDRLTVLKVSLTPTGQLADVVVLEGSGVSFLDDEAVRAFRAAQPFPNPPHALVDGGTQLITFSFGFHFQIDGPSDSWWKFRRY